MYLQLTNLATPPSCRDDNLPPKQCSQPTSQLTCVEANSQAKDIMDSNNNSVIPFNSFSNL
jgi:hypothetical protein